MKESGAYLPNSTQEGAAVQPRARANVIVETVVDPSAVDVLCGRGGMSNHHPGNEWYRRLIRSNRPLYRACPKHTKLLVAKAIVQAVQEQQGRFLERDFDSGVWYVIPYKRAVDKTSQGLRERERDDGPVSRQVTDMKAMLQYPEEGPPQVPSSRKPAASKAPPTQSSQRGKAKAPPPPPPPPKFTKNNNIIPSDPQANMTHAASLQQGFQQSTASLPAADSLHRQPTMTPLPVAGTETQLLREASFYRLLKHTQLMPHQTSMMASTEYRNYASGAVPQPTAIPPSAYYGNAPPPSMSAPSMAIMASYGGGAPPPTEPPTAPGLTRFTSQVSDWLNFFWPAESERPLPAAAETAAPPPPVAAAAPPVKEEEVELEEAAVATAPPTELEQSVSLTLLTLAGSPSKLLAGSPSKFFSGLFYGEQSTKKKDSLLDDHEETPMEQRMRTLPPQQFA